MFFCRVLSLLFEELSPDVGVPEEDEPDELGSFTPPDANPVPSPYALERKFPLNVPDAYALA